MQVHTPQHGGKRKSKWHVDLGLLVRWLVVAKWIVVVGQAREASLTELRYNLRYNGHTLKQFNVRCIGHDKPQVITLSGLVIALKRYTLC